MIHSRALHPLWTGNLSETLTFHTPRLTDEQFACLSKCARGISIRFEGPELVDALVGCGYAEKRVAGVVNVTAKGQHYLQTRAG